MKLKKGLWICSLAVMSLFITSCTKKAEVKDSDKSIYEGSIQDADVFIDIPNLRQYGGYTCGTTCVQMLMNWINPYQGDLNLKGYEEELGTTEDAGTSPEQLMKYFEKNDVKAVAKEERIIKDLVSVLDKKHPMLMCIQAWGAEEYNTQDKTKTDTYLAEGHWVICVGYQKVKNDYVFYFNDPACVGYCMMNEKDLKQRWIDMDADGRIYDQYGIEIAENENIYDPQGAFYLE